MLRVKLRQDTTGANPGNGKTGLTSSSTGLIISTAADNEATATAYTAAGSTIESITTLGTYAAPTGTKCRFKEYDATNHKGIYEIQIADARFAVSSAKSMLISISGVSGVSDCDVTIPLRSFDQYDGVRGNLTAFPNVASGSAGSLPTTGTGANQLSVSSGQVILQSGTGAGQLDFTSGVVKSNLAQILGTALTETAGQIAAAFRKFFNVASPTGTVNSIPDAVAGANGGLLIAGSNAATTFATLTSTGTFTINGTSMVAQTGDSYAIVNSGSFGNSALLTAVQNVQNNTFIATSIPGFIERPDAGSVTINISFVFSDETGAAKNLDSGNPAITLVNDAGTDLSSRLGVFTNPATGKYVVPYTSSVGDTLEGLHWDVTGTINSKLRRTVAYTQIVDTTAVSFTATDRTNLGAIKTKTDQLNFTGSALVQADVVDWKGTTAPANTGDAYARLGAAGAGLTALGDTRIAHLDADISSRMATFTLPTNFSALGITAGGHILNVDTLTTYTGNTPQTGDAYARIGAAGAGLTAVVLGATGLDAIAVTDPGGVAGQTTLPKMIIALWRRFFKKATMTSSQLKTYADDGTTVNTTQALTDDGTTQTEGAAT